MVPCVVGSDSRHKKDAVVLGLQRLEWSLLISTIKAESGVNAEPVGYLEILQGAKRRASQAHASHPNAYGVGIESGILRIALNYTLETSVIVVIAPGGTDYIGCAPCIRVPERYVIEAERLGFSTVTVGSVIAKLHGSDPTDPVAWLTHGRLTRREVMCQGVIAAFSQIPPQL